MSSRYVLDEFFTGGAGWPRSGPDKMSEKMTVESWLVHPLSTVSQQHKNPKLSFKQTT